MIVLDLPGVKECRGCEESFPLRDFPTYKARGKRYHHSRCVDCRREAERGYKRAAYERRKPYRIQWYYGITIERRDEMLREQGGCAICGVNDPGNRDWCVDHDHTCCPGKRSCGKCVRGILCSGCNVSIGLMGDDPHRLRRAADYLQRKIH